MKTQREGFQGQKLIRIPIDIRKTFFEDPVASQLFISDIGFYPPVNNHQVIRKIPLEQQILIYCIDGEGWCKLHGKKNIIKKNNFFVIPDNTPHAYGNTPDKSWTVYWIHFNGHQAASFGRNLCDGKFGQGIPLIPRMELLQLFHEIVADLENGLSPEACSYANARLWHVLGEVSYHKRFASDTDKNIIDKAIAFMKEKVEEHITLNELARYLHLSPTYFSRLFKKRMGQPPIDYFIRLKIQRSCQYLDFTNMTIQDVAFQLRYEDPYYFSRVFKRIMGVSPANYRLAHKL